MAALAPLQNQCAPAAAVACQRCGTVHVCDELRQVHDAKALAQLRGKLVDLADRIEDMSEDEYGHWLNALPFTEFLEFIVLDEACMGAIMAGHAPARDPACNTSHSRRLADMPLANPKDHHQ